MSDQTNDPSEDVRMMWEGVEVEGRYAGLQTLFTLVPVLPLHRPPHLFICPQASARRKLALDIAQCVRDWRATGRVVTVAVFPEDLKHLHPYVLTHAHVMVDINIDFQTLKPTDTIKVQLAPYTTRSTTLGQMSQSNPADYTNDTPTTDTP